MRLTYRQKQLIKWWPFIAVMLFSAVLFVSNIIFNPGKLGDGSFLGFVMVLMMTGFSLAGVTFNIKHGKSGFNYKMIVPIIFVLGLLGFFGGSLLSIWGWPVPQSIQFPFGDAKGLAVGDSGRIYLGLRFLGRIQVYDQKGSFLKSLYVPDSFGGHYAFRLDNRDRLHIKTEDHFIIYNQDGREIFYGKNHSRLPHDQPGNYVTDKSGNAYILDGAIMDKCVIKKTPDGRRFAVVTSPLNPLILFSPGISWVLTGIGFWLMFRFDGKRLAKKKNA